MKLALLADIHSNIEALDACLEHAAGEGAERFAVLGDLVGYGADPAAVIDRIAGLGQRVLHVLQGNHDAAVCGQMLGDMNPEAAQAIVWTRARLGAGHLDYLAGLPLIIRDEDVTWVHASALEPERFDYVCTAADARASIEAAASHYVFCGHVHEPCLYFTGADGRMSTFFPRRDYPIPVLPHRHWLAIVGSCGQPRDGSTGAWYAIFDRGAARLTFHRVAYDTAAAAAKIRAAGLPERFALQIEGLV